MTSQLTQKERQSREFLSTVNTYLRRVGELRQYGHAIAIVRNELDKRKADRQPLTLDLPPSFTASHLGGEVTIKVEKLARLRHVLTQRLEWGCERLQPPPPFEQISQVLREVTK